MSGLKYHNIYTCFKAQICLLCNLLQTTAIFFLHFVLLCSDLMASSNPFQNVAMAARRVPDDFCGGRRPFSRFLVILVLCGQISQPPANGNSCPMISMPIWIFAARDTALRHISPTDVWPVKLRSLLHEVLSLPPMPSAALIAMLCRTCSFFSMASSSLSLHIWLVGSPKTSSAYCNFDVNMGYYSHWLSCVKNNNSKVL
jgi:hypothetical protein